MLNCVAYIQNISSHKTVDAKTPYEAWFGHKPNISHFKIFGSRAWARIPLDKRKVLQPQRKGCIVVGYAEYSNGYNLFDPSSQNTFIERSVQFEEELMPELELAPRECSTPPLQDDVSDESISDIYNIYDSHITEYDDEYHGSPIRPKWDEKTIEETGDLDGNPLDPKKIRSQFHIAFSKSEVVLYKKLFMMVGYYPK